MKEYLRSPLQSALNIEAAAQRGEIPLDLREPIGGLLYGCDICQTCCPWNVRFSRLLPNESVFAARHAVAGKDARQLARELLGMTPADFAGAFSGSPMKRPKLRGLRRNAAVVLGNVGDARDVEVLGQALADEEPLVREHAAWALERLRTRGVTPEVAVVPSDAAGYGRQTIDTTA